MIGEPGLRVGQAIRAGLPAALAALALMGATHVLDARQVGSRTPARGSTIVWDPPIPPPAMSDLRVTVPAGEFWMGRTRIYLMDEIGWQLRERADDRPVHRVRLNAFAIDVYEVTNGDYAKFIADPAAKVEPPFHWGGRTPPAGKERHPVYNVTWLDAQKYCQTQGGRLPTEAEWERAARGDAVDLDYPWGNDYEPEPPAPPAATADATGSAGTALGATAAPPPGGRGAARTRANRRAHSGSSTGPVAVGSFPPNSLGLYDVSGNVWEWTADWYDLHYYSVSPVDSPTGPASGRYKVIRGGSWADNETRLGTLYYRNYTAPDTAQPTVGFRCVAPAR